MEMSIQRYSDVFVSLQLFGQTHRFAPTKNIDVIGLIDKSAPMEFAPMLGAFLLAHAFIIE